MLTASLTQLMLLLVVLAFAAIIAWSSRRRAPVNALGILALIGFVLVGGCASNVGPVVRQDIKGQDTANSVLNKATFTDGAPFVNADGSTTVPGTTAFETVGPVESIKMTNGVVNAQSSGIVPRSLTIQRPDGLTVTLRSGSDAAGKIMADPATGNLSSFEFNTSSSGPMDALGRVTSAYQETMQKLPVAQREAIEIQTKGFIEAVDKISTVVGASLRASLGIPVP